MNTDKKEYVCPWCLGGGAKLLEWAANPQGAIFTLLLRKSDKGGGGDCYGYRTQEIQLESDTPDAIAESLVSVLQQIPFMEGQPVVATQDAMAGRWAGDRVVLVGDYDSSDLWDRLDGYRNISADLVEEWNRFMDIPEMQLEVNLSCTCGQAGG